MVDESIIDKLKIPEVLDYFSKFISDPKVQEIAAGSGNIIAAIFGGVQMIRKFKSHVYTEMSIWCKI